jgi:hypothetical protein
MGTEHLEEKGIYRYRATMGTRQLKERSNYWNQASIGTGQFLKLGAVGTGQL